MQMTCNDRERIFLDGTPAEWAALQSHAESCAACSEELRSWRNLSIAANDLHHEWDSPELWPGIVAALSDQAPARVSGFHRFWRNLGLPSLPLLQWQTAVAGLLLVALTAASIWFVASHGQRRIPQDQALLNRGAVRDVEKAEAAYERAIDKLDAQARPELESAATPLMASYREKLLVLDSAISDLKSQTGVNPANGHLRRQLLAMYQEKQDTLEQVLEAKQ
jgi:hypothetical protein